MEYLNKLAWEKKSKKKYGVFEKIFVFLVKFQCKWKSNFSSPYIWRVATGPVILEAVSGQETKIFRKSLLQVYKNCLRLIFYDLHTSDTLYSPGGPVCSYFLSAPKKIWGRDWKKYYDIECARCMHILKLWDNCSLVSFKYPTLILEPQSTFQGVCGEGGLKNTKKINHFGGPGASKLKKKSGVKPKPNWAKNFFCCYQFFQQKKFAEIFKKPLKSYL